MHFMLHSCFEVILRMILFTAYIAYMLWRHPEGDWLSQHEERLCGILFTTHSHIKQKAKLLIYKEDTGILVIQPNAKPTLLTSAPFADKLVSCSSLTAFSIFKLIPSIQLKCKAGEINFLSLCQQDVRDSN